MANLTMEFPFDEIIEKFREVVKQEISVMGGGTVHDNEAPINTKQLCEYLNLTEPTIIRWRQKGKIPFFQIGSAIRYNKSDVMDALRINTKANPKKLN